MNASGKTGQPLVIQVPSMITRAAWLADRVAAGGEVGLEVGTNLVADGSPIEIELRTASGSQIQVFQGQVYGDTHRRRILVPGNVTEDIVFNARLTEHQLEKLSPKLLVAPALRITETKWYDAQGAELTELQDGAPATGKAKIQGRPDGAKATITVVLTETNGRDQSVQKAECVIAQQLAQIQLKWSYGDKSQNVAPRQERERQGGTYAQPEIALHVECDGVKAVGLKIPIAQEIVLTYQSGDGEAGPYKGKQAAVTTPDGQRTEYPVPDDGVIRVPRTKPGHYEIEHPVPDTPK